MKCTITSCNVESADTLSAISAIANVLAQHLVAVSVDIAGKNKTTLRLKENGTWTIKVD